MARSTYNQIKEYNGKRYTGMAVGRGHTWKYDAGDWKERKVTPDRWEFRYAVVKRRAGKAPEGSGAPVGTSHHWYIVADQVVTKLDANSYMTEMVGHKIKVAHRRAGQTSWNASEHAQRKHLVQQLRELADELEAQAAAPPEGDAKPQETATSDGHGKRRTTAQSRSAHRATRTTRARPQARAHAARARHKNASR